MMRNDVEHLGLSQGTLKRAALLNVCKKVGGHFAALI